MKNYNQKLVVSGIALLLFGIIIAVMSNSALSYVFGGLGLFFVILGCFAKERQNENEQ